MAQLICGMPPQITPFHAPSITRHITDSTFLLPSLQPTNQFEPITAAPQPTPESSALLPSPLQHQANCLQAIHKALQQFSQHLKAEHPDRQALQLLALQLQNNFPLLRYLLFSEKDTAAKDSATSPLINATPNPNRNPNPNPTSSAFPLPCTDDAQLRRSTPVGAVGPPRAKTMNSANAVFQPTLNTQEAPPTMKQNSHQEFANWKKCLLMK